MGRNLSEAIEMRDAAHAAKRVLKIGFNHRYHPAISEAHHRFTKGEIGEIISLRARYGHGGRAGYEKEWRANKTLSGGGELTDQGVHIVDLFHWFAGVPAVAFAFLQTAVWPLGELEDNGFGLFRYGTGAVGSLHTSWTQWKNLFSLEIFGKTGALIVDGLGRSYGTETLILHQRKPEGGAPVTESWAFDQEDDSWDLEWQDFQGAVLGDAPMLGTAEDGVVAMRMIEALYRSAGTGKAETV
jgi:predicted dehydrogenase